MMKLKDLYTKRNEEKKKELLKAVENSTKTYEVGSEPIYVCRSLNDSREKRTSFWVFFFHIIQNYDTIQPEITARRKFMKKSKKLAKISTTVIGIYLLFLVVIGVKTALLCHDFSKIGMIGIDLSAGAKNLDDYISGYAMVPGAFFTLLGSSFGGVIFFLLMFAIVFACVVLLVHIVISCILIRKEKLRTDAMLKLVMAIVGLLFSVILLKSAALSFLMVVPLLMAMVEYNYAKTETEEKV